MIMRTMAFHLHRCFCKLTLDMVVDENLVNVMTMMIDTMMIDNMMMTLMIKTMTASFYLLHCHSLQERVACYVTLHL